MVLQTSVQGTALLRDKGGPDTGPPDVNIIQIIQLPLSEAGR